MTSIKGRTVLVTGAGGAIGRETVLQLLAAGAEAMTIVDIPGSDVESFAAGCCSAETDVRGYVADVADRSAFGKVVAESLGFMGRVDVLVNVAGYWQIVDFVDSDPDQWNTMISANLLTAISACHAVLPQMIEQGDGSIVNFASTAGEYGSVRPSAAYAAAKGGVISFTKSLAREVSPHGIRVNALSPGPIDTPALKAASEEARREAADRTLLRRLGQPGDIAAGVVYLAGDSSRFVTGTVLQVNGGSLL
ncbi:MAG: SDR family NAD(P)-dependent oxidoreductase [Limisphaerales bacterium]